MSTNELRDCCDYIGSDKISERKKYCIKLSSILEDHNKVKLINNGTIVTWKNLIKSLQRCLKKDAEKTIEDAKKKVIKSVSANYHSSELFVQVIRKALKEGGNVDILELVGYIIGCMNESNMRKCYEKEFLGILKNILLNSKCRGQLKSDDWQEMYDMLKRMLDTNTENTLIYDCFMTVIKYGPVCGLSPSLLRQEYDFLTKICQKVSQTSPRLLQENILEIAVELCTHTANDNRLSCCKFGENIFTVLEDLYELNGKPQKTKELLVKFFLLQVMIHHPNGAVQGSSSAYSNNWNQWKRILKTMYNLINKEIQLYFKLSLKNTLFFTIKDEKTTLCPYFCRLFVELSKQVFMYPDLDVSMAVFSMSTPMKRQKREVNLASLIENIKESNSWLWIHLVSSVIKIYPALIEIDEYMSLLEILYSIQIENNDYNVIENVYICLSTMIHIQNLLNVSNHEDKINKLWRLIGENTTRAFGLNQHKEVTENLLEELIHRGITTFEDTLQTYQSDVINLAPESIGIFNAGLRFIDLNNDINKKKLIMKCILKSQNLREYKYLCNKETAMFLLKLTLKQWQPDEQKLDRNKECCEYDNLQKIYVKILLDENSIVTNDIVPVEKDRNSQDIDFDFVGILLKDVKDFVVNGEQSEIILFSKIILLVNISSCLTEYQIIPEKKCQTFLTQLLEQLFNDTIIKDFKIGVVKNDRDAVRLTECVDVMNNLFSLKISKWTMATVKRLFPSNLLKTLAVVLDYNKEQKQTSSVKSNLMISIIQALSSFSCICGNSMSTTQEHFLNHLTQPNYDFSIDDDYNMFFIILKTLKLSEPGILPNAIIYNILECIKDICIERCENAEDILFMLLVLFPHMAASDNLDYKSTSVEFLQPFYDDINNHGSNVALTLLECFKVLCQLDTRNSFSKWHGTDIIKYVPEFLKNEYVEVRFKAIEVLVIYFKNNYNSKIIEDIHKQEELFSKINEMSMQVFNVFGITTDERRLDEAISRTSSVLFTYGDIAINCDDWLEESIYSLIKIGKIKNIDSLDKIFSIINKQKFGDANGNIIEKYIVYLVDRWSKDNYKFEDFPYKLLNCSTLIEFYKKHFEECAPIFIAAAKDGIATIAQALQVTKDLVIENTAAKVFVHALCTDMDLTNDILSKNNILLQFSNIIGVNRLKNILSEQLDQIVLGILEFLTDESDLQGYFGESVIFFTKFLNANDINSCFTFIQEFIGNDQPLGLLLTDRNLTILPNILLELKCKIYNSIALKEKLKYFHRYAFFINVITKTIKTNSCWRHFFIRDVIHSSLNMIENNENCTVMILAASRFLYNFLRQILPEFAATFKDFFCDTVNSLKKFYATRTVITEVCKDVLKFLIVENRGEFKEEIKYLDTFPENNDFNEICTVQKKIRYSNSEPRLEEEIVQFLNHKDILIEEDSLVHLRTLLAKQKDKLEELYQKLHDIRGFSEDCENSLLHRLVCVLAKLCCSPNLNVSLEAARCLGEMGPANLQTLVLQPEKNLVHAKHPSFEVLLGTVISLLTKHIIDCDINVIKVASKTLFVVLNSKEGKKISDSLSDFGYGSINKNYIIPYFPSSSSSSQNPTVNVELFTTKFKSDEFWCPMENISHSNWITSLVTNLLESFIDHTSFLNKLIDMCKKKVDFSECLLPLIVDLLVSLSNNRITTLLSKQIEGFFNKHWDCTVRSTANEEDLIILNKRSVKCVLNVVNYVRLMKHRFARQRTQNEFTINYLKVAKAAEFCANHFSALYYSELWSQQIIDQIQVNSIYCEQRSSMIDHIYENEDPLVADTLHNILRNAYKAIGDFDALPGCGLSFLLQPKYRVEYYKEQGKFEQVIQYYANQDVKNYLSSKEVVDSFKSCNLYQIPLICSQLEDPEYECLWRLGQWDFVEKKRMKAANLANYEDIEKYKFYSLKALHDNNQCAFEESLKSQFLCTINHVKNISLESSHSLYPIFTQLQSLVEIENFSESCKLKTIAMILKKWKLHDKLIKKSDFRLVEPIIAQRLIMLTDYLTKNEDDNVSNYIIELSFDFANWAKDESYFTEGLQILSNLKKIPVLNDDTLIKINLLDAELSWSVKNTLVAKHILNRLSKNERINPKLKAAVLKLTGNYASETHSENRSTISQYFLDSISLMGTVQRNEEDKKNIMETYDQLAVFADREYVQIMAYLKSDLFQKKIANMKQAKKNASSIQKQRKKTYEENKAAAIYDRNSNIDEQEIKSTKAECNTFLHLALKYYLLCLIHSDDKNIRIFRVISLFLENRKNVDITKTIEEYLPKLPSYKYIIVLPQLIPHLSLESEKDLFNEKVNEIVERCALEHPHHTLPLLLSLANAYKDREFEDSMTKTSTNDARFETAKKLLVVLNNKGLSEKIKRLNKVSVALIHLAYFKSRDEGNDRKKEFTITKDQKIMQIRDFDDVLVPTYTLPINKSKNYSNIVGISSFKSTYEIVGGVNKPKKILCRGTDGHYHSQLVKGQDDLRQDAVMQQVFNIMNNLLSYNKSTNHLLIRTYKIVPLSMRSGILKWADNSLPIGEYLTGGSDNSKGAHQKYRPKDKLPSNCREIFKNCAGKTTEHKLNVYKSICASFKPVFHHFFEENFLQPAVWYERRRAYIHSVATTSMCGYILGIGDRHTSNILIDKTTAEVIHIDFGIAFEQGRVLPTPETVPFRLTRDMVDAMGSSGVEGIFRRSCEKTMEALRQNAQTIITILEVLLYDPLYAWTVTSAEANKRQTDSDNSIGCESSDSSEDPTNISAERALLRLREKLQGTELGNPRSVEHQVGTLIQQAIDPVNLCRLYVGWQPYV